MFHVAKVAKSNPIMYNVPYLNLRTQVDAVYAPVNI